MNECRTMHMMNTSLLVYEDDDLAVINKPAGVVVNRAQTNTKPSLQEWWEQYLRDGAKTTSSENSQDWQALVPEDFSDQYGSPETIFNQRGGIVHRLDKDTSGALLLAKNPGALVNLLAQFKERKVVKTYQALVHGKLEVAQADLNYPIMRSTRDAMKMFVHPDGRPSLTEYSVLSEYQDPRSPTEVLSLVECFPKTGRMHQVRVHFAHIRHPLVSDRLYAGRKRYKQDITWCPRHFLHAHKISFIHPRTQEVLSVEAVLADDLQKSLSLLQTQTN